MKNITNLELTLLHFYTNYNSEFMDIISIDSITYYDEFSNAYNVKIFDI
jgi:hypothetical protein